MDLITLIVVLAGLAGIVSLLYIAIIGQKSIPEWWRARRQSEVPPQRPLKPSKPPVPEIPHNLPQPGEFIGREREKAQVREALASRSFLVSIDGIGGIGKTALALEVTCECLRASKGEILANGVPTFDAFV